MDGVLLNKTKLFDFGNIEICDDYFKKVKEEASKRFDLDKFPIFIGGDHSVTIPLQEAFFDYCKKNNKIPAIIHLDAHPDICDFYDGSKLSHACTNRRSIDYGYKTKNITMIGIRGFEAEEVEYLNNHKELKVYTANICYEYGIKNIINDLKNKFFDEFRNINSRFMLFYLLLIGVFVFSLMVQILNYYTYGLIFSMLSLGIFILLACYISSIKRRSESGNEDYVRWRAFRNFLLEFGRFEDYTMPLIEIWEHYMVYAVSFGIAEEVEKQMRLRFKSMGEDEYNSYYSSSPIFYSRSYIYVSRSCRSSTTIARATIAQAQAARAGSSSSGRGGGFGGGRSFGGGGGGRGFR